jgi:hypothetical protein
MTRPADPPHTGDEALDEFVCSMAGIWRDVFDREPGRSVPQDRDRDGRRRDGGRFPRFVLTALKRLRKYDMPTEVQISDRTKKLRGMGKL